jgi:hypothetical protein
MSEETLDGTGEHFRVPLVVSDQWLHSLGQTALVSISGCHWSYPTSVFIPLARIENAGFRAAPAPSTVPAAGYQRLPRSSAAHGL